jgi:hypothetical protein
MRGGQRAVDLECALGERDRVGILWFGKLCRLFNKVEM